MIMTLGDAARVIKLSLQTHFIINFRMNASQMKTARKIGCFKIRFRKIQIPPNWEINSETNV